MEATENSGLKFCVSCRRPIRTEGQEYCYACRKKLGKQMAEKTMRTCARCGRPILNRGYNQYCAACRRVEDYENKPYASQNGEGKRPPKKRKLASGPNDILLQREFLEKTLRRCHDCGKPTANYRCDECWAKLRRKLGLRQDGGEAQALVYGNWRQFLNG